MLDLIVTFFRGYYFFRERIPFFVYAFYLFFKDVEDYRVNAFIEAFIFGLKAILFYSFLGLVFGVGFTDWIPMDWNYSGLMNWGIFFIIYYNGLIGKEKNVLTSFTISVLAVLSGGWLYEICFFHPIGMFMNYSNLFLVDSQILCIVLLGYEFWKMGFKITYKIGIAFLVFSVFSYALFIDFRFVKNIVGSGLISMWIARVPASLFLISLIGGLDE